MTALEKLMAEATPMPWRCGLSERDPQKRKANEKLFVHAVNVLPKLVEALEEIQNSCPRYSDDDGINAGLLRIMQVTNGAIAEANNPEASK